MLKKKIGSGISLLLLLSSPLFTQEAESFFQSLSPEAKKELNENGSVFRYDKKGRGPIFLPLDSERAVKEIYQEVEPNTFVEGVYRLELPVKNGTKEENLLFIFNALLELRALDGTPYFSNRRQKYVPLFSQVYRVDQPKRGGMQLPDEKVLTLPSSKSIYLHLKENRLGAAFYQVDYLADQERGEMIFVMKNIDTLRVVFPVVKPEKMAILIQLFLLDNELILYGSVSVQFSNEGLVNSLMDPYFSFLRRLQAYTTWLANSLYQREELPPKNPTAIED